MGDSNRRVDSYLTALTTASKAPGIQYRAVTCTGVLCQHASGWADLRLGIPVDAATTILWNDTWARCRTARVSLSGSSSPTPPASRIQFGTIAMTNATGFDVGKLLDTIDRSFLCRSD
jgi:hypothetical protein